MAHCQQASPLERLERGTDSPLRVLVVLEFGEVPHLGYKLLTLHLLSPLTLEREATAPLSRMSSFTDD